MKLSLAYFYPEELNLYGDHGNIEILLHRAKKRGFEVDLHLITSQTLLDGPTMDSFNLVFMGGGPDSGQKSMYEDLILNKGNHFRDYIENGGTSLFICGSYQLMGKYYKSSDGSFLEGLDIFDLYTQHFGHQSTRCVGNIVCKLSPILTEDSLFKNVNHIGDTIVGFENHGGKTYLGKETAPLAEVIFGYGNNLEDKSEGIIYKNSIGTYMHGPFLSKNPHIADFLLAKALKVDALSQLDDTIIKTAHSALVKRFR